MKILFTGFKGKNNTSFQLLYLLSASDKLLLTNSFSGLLRDIESFPLEIESYERVVMFGIDKTLTEHIRIEKAAKCNGQLKRTEYDIAALSNKLDNVRIGFEIAQAPAQGLCNEAYFHMLLRNACAVFIHIPSQRGMTQELMQKLVSVFSELK